MKNSSVEEHLICQKSYEDWFQTTLGRQLLAEQRALVFEKCADAYGSHQIELAISHRLPVASNGNIPHRVAVVPKREADMPDGVVAALPHELPLAQHSVDLVIMHHTLDYASFPHQTLREVSRSLKSGGHLLIIGFNPLSFWGMRRVFNRDRGHLGMVALSQVSVLWTGLSCLILKSTERITAFIKCRCNVGPTRKNPDCSKR